MGRLLTAILAGIFAVISLTLSTVAQDAPPRSPLGVGPPAAERGLNALRPSAAKQAAPAETGVLARAWAWVLATQQRINRELVAAVRGLKTDPVHATFVLAWLSFAYGVLHAAGPGHGKAVISAYVLANERTVRRGILLSFMAAFFQALSALLIVGILSVALKATSLTMKSAEAWIETLSWALVACVGAWLLHGQLRPLLSRYASPTAAPASDARGDQHAHDPRPGQVEVQGVSRSTDARATSEADCCGGDDLEHGHQHHHHHHHHHGHGGQPAGGRNAAGGTTAMASVQHDHVHDDDCGCGHLHMPAPRDLDGAWSWRKALALAFAVGIRPCTGAILVLLFALSQGLVWAGVMATFAMAIGTAITVSALAALAVGSKELATRLAGGASGGWASAIASTAGILGSSLVLLMGAAFFVASLRGPAPF